MPNLMEVYDSLGDDKWLVIIGLILDESSDAPKRFVTEQRIPWIQVCLGAESRGQITRSYGVQSIPATFLIDPDGKIIAKGMRGKEIKSVVKTTLGKGLSLVDVFMSRCVVGSKRSLAPMRRDDSHIISWQQTPLRSYS
jgi:Thioredoxin-like